ncbi:MAG TPA: response regulator [Terriglobales bacterium]|nr:response regulator [Terriglobales bacterium]
MIAKPKILVVDDDAQSRQLYVSLLSPFGYHVTEAADGQQGLELARTERPDLIISDILMPTMNGYEFVSAVRKTPALKSVPIIFHSASFLDREARSLGASCGVSQYILKPSDPEKVLDIVHNALGIHPKAPSLPDIPITPALPSVETETIPLLLDAFFEKGKQLDASSVRLSALLDLAMNFAACSSEDDVLAAAASATRKILGANYAAAALLGDDGTHVRSLALAGLGPEIAAKIDKSSFAGEVFKNITRTRKPYKAFNPFGGPPGIELPPLHPPTRSFLGVALSVEGRTLGWMYVAEKIDSLTFDDLDARVLTALAAQTALACENAQRYRMIQEHARKLESEVAERQRAEDRFRMLVETAPTGIIIADQTGRIVDANAHALKMFGYTRNEVMGQPIELFIPEALRFAHEKHRTVYSANPHARPMGMGLDLFACRKDRTAFPVEVSLGPLVTQGETLVSAAIVDITARKKMEEQLRISQRMEAIGRLAGGVAHDFNNLLTVILGCCDVMADQIPADESAAQKLEMVTKAANSAADLTRQLLAFGRKQVLQPRVIEPREILNGIKKILTRLIGENIRVKFSVGSAVGCVNADPGQLEQVLVNLATNARDAMPDGGNLTIEVLNAEFDENYKQCHPPALPGSYVMFAVSDTGCGMDRKTQSQIFHPFFTTKELGKGTGLGLATVYGIVKQSGGFIWVYSEKGKGTTFKIYLPRVERQPGRDHVDPDVAAEGGSETVLLAEDSESLREMAREYMESLGYTVIEAESGEQALTLSDEYEGIIHLLLTDVVMSKMSGRELAERIREKRPSVRILFSSGYTDDAIVRHGVLEPGVAFIQKPYRPKALARKIREVLANNPAPSSAKNSTTAQFPVKA